MPTKDCLGTHIDSTALPHDRAVLKATRAGVQCRICYLISMWRCEAESKSLLSPV